MLREQVHRLLEFQGGGGMEEGGAGSMEREVAVLASD
jgi:hypothetical protein